MTIFLSHFQQTRAVVPRYVAQQTEPVEMIPDTEMRLTLNVDVALHVNNPKLAILSELARTYIALIEEAEKTESTLQTPLASVEQAPTQVSNANVSNDAEPKGTL